jgi:hypothetical protein
MSPVGLRRIDVARVATTTCRNLEQRPLVDQNKSCREFTVTGTHSSLCLGEQRDPCEISNRSRGTRPEEAKTNERKLSGD